MSDPLFMDFDAAASERGEKEENIATFVYGGETFEVDRVPLALKRGEKPTIRR